MVENSKLFITIHIIFYIDTFHLTLTNVMILLIIKTYLKTIKITADYYFYFCIIYGSRYYNTRHYINIYANYTIMY